MSCGLPRAWRKKLSSWTMGGLLRLATLPGWKIPRAREASASSARSSIDIGRCGRRFAGREKKRRVRSYVYQSAWNAAPFGDGHAWGRVFDFARGRRARADPVAL